MLKCNALSQCHVVSSCGAPPYRAASMKIFKFFCPLRDLDCGNQINKSLFPRPSELQTQWIKYQVLQPFELLHASCQGPIQALLRQMSRSPLLLVRGVAMLVLQQHHRVRQQFSRSFQVILMCGYQARHGARHRTRHEHLFFQSSLMCFECRAGYESGKKLTL